MSPIKGALFVEGKGEHRAVADGRGADPGEVHGLQTGVFEDGRRVRDRRERRGVVYAGDGNVERAHEGVGGSVRGAAIVLDGDGDDGNKKIT